MSINFEEIPSVIELPAEESTQKTITVLEEINARQYLLNERSIKCDNIKPFYAKIKKPPHPYYYKNFCVCPRYKPQYSCKHAGNIIFDRDALTHQERLFYLATPKVNYAARRKMPRSFTKKAIIADCTARIINLAKPDLKHVAETLSHFNDIMPKRHKISLKKCLEKSTNIEYTTIQRALELLCEEKRLKRVAKRKERLNCQKLSRKIVNKQKQQIKKIMNVLYEEMKEFLLNDQFNIIETSTLETVILEALREFTDKEFNMTNNLREYQKTLAFNLALWINGFLSNLNIDIAETAPYTEQTQLKTKTEEPTQELTTFLPIDDYILHSKDSENLYYEEALEEDYHSLHNIKSTASEHI